MVDSVEPVLNAATTRSMRVTDPCGECMYGMSTMTPAHFSGMDLNLLVALDALLAERSVTRAGQRVGLTQSAMSRALARLRDSLDDALLVRAGRDLVLTPRASALQQPLREALRQLETAVRPAPAFDPATAKRTFHISTADYGMAVAIPPLLARLQHCAPGIDLVVHPQHETFDAALAAGTFDVVMVPKRASSPGIVWTPLFSEHFSCVVREGHLVIGKKLTLKALCAVPHVFVSPGGGAHGVVDEALAKRGLQRRIALRVPSFLIAPLVVAQSDAIAMLPTRLAQQLARHLPIRVLPAPLSLPGFTVALGWHERMRDDPAHTWLRRLIVEIARSL